jgi:hypothetical protein
MTYGLGTMVEVPEIRTEFLKDLKGAMLLISG